MKLEIDLVPRTSWYSNVRSNVNQIEWDIIRKKSYKKAKYQCEICYEVGPNHPVECHEIWEYNEEKGFQILKGFISLCPNCHQVKHFGLAQINGKGEQALNHLKKVNSINDKEANEHVKKAFDIWYRRNETKWYVDITYIKEFLNNN